jgi:hypothetical protein
MNEAPDNWTNPFGKWMDELKADNPEFFQFMNNEPVKERVIISEINVPRVTKDIHVVDQRKTYHLVLTPEGKRFIAQDKLMNAEALGLSVRSL